MRPETFEELIIVIAWSIIAVISSIAVKLQWVTHTTFFALLGCSSGLLTLFYGIRHYFRIRPYIRRVSTSDWSQDEEITLWRSVRIMIPEANHRKGKFPKVEFGQNGEFLCYEISKDGNITIFHRENSFMPPWREFTVRVTAT
jgi:hypothetical protein